MGSALPTYRPVLSRTLVSIGLTIALGELPHQVSGLLVTQGEVGHFARDSSRLDGAGADCISPALSASRARVDPADTALWHAVPRQMRHRPYQPALHALMCVNSAVAFTWPQSVQVRTVGRPNLYGRSRTG